MGRNRLAVARGRLRLAGHDLAEDRLRARARERRLATEHLVENAPEGVDVALRTRVPVRGGLLGAHVIRRAEREPRLGQPALPRRADGQGDAEVSNEGAAVLKEDVRRLDVPVDNALAVGIVQGSGDVDRDPERLFHRKLALPIEPLAQGLPLHVRHHVEEEGVRLSGIEERKHVGMLQVRGRLDLADESLASDDGCELGLEDLERHLPPVLQVLGQVDRGHAALAELPLDRVAALQGGGGPPGRR
jgi:hypothetical protein